MLFLIVEAIDCCNVLERDAKEWANGRTLKEDRNWMQVAEEDQRVIFRRSQLERNAEIDAVTGKKRAASAIAEDEDSAHQRAKKQREQTRADNLRRQQEQRENTRKEPDFSALLDKAVAQQKVQEGKETENAKATASRAVFEMLSNAGSFTAGFDGARHWLGTLLGVTSAAQMQFVSLDDFNQVLVPPAAFVGGLKPIPRTQLMSYVDSYLRSRVVPVTPA